MVYFKEMEEREDEKGNYRILRKVGLRGKDVLKGIGMKEM